MTAVLNNSNLALSLVDLYQREKSTSSATAPELAAQFEVSQRTIYRDIDALSSAGIPVYTEPGRNGGICLLHDFILDR